jgi:spermidine synthase
MAAIRAATGVSQRATRSRRFALSAASAVTPLFAATILLAAALMFIAEPMLARMILPRLGGSPAVWNTCLVFFQATLLGGYIYAHVLTRALTLKQQVVVHAALLLVAATVLPIGGIGAGWVPPVDRWPVPWLLLVLTAGVGAPFFILSTTSPLLQHWLAHTNHQSSKDPYYLYSASNVGSIVALLGYPLVIEPLWPLTGQGAIWTFGYCLFAALTMSCAVLSIRFYIPPVEQLTDAQATAETVGWQQRCQWVLLAVVPSSLLLSVTTFLSTDVAAAPLLWTVPLTLYLLSFVFAFARKEVISGRNQRRALSLAIAPVVLLMAIAPGRIVMVLLPLHLAAFFLSALTLHTGLARRRPAAHHLTEFYLWISVGGVIGGLVNTFVAPLVFTNIAEYPLGLAAACLLQPWAADARPPRVTRSDFTLPGTIALAVLATIMGVRLQLLDLGAFVIMLTITLGLVVVTSLGRPLRFGLAITGVLLATYLLPTTRDSMIYANRTFFGVLRVQRSPSSDRHTLLHGVTVHGVQDLRGGWRDQPLTYYHRSGPIGQLMAAFGDRLEAAHIGVVGLGAGSLAAYATSHQQWTFFEIDPAVAAIARERQLFTYLNACSDRCRIVLGDARLSLARTNDGPFDLLVLDAFSSDAIPVHLMTREALELYLWRLTGDGVLAFHISNRHLDLEPVLATLAGEQKLVALVQYDKASDNRDVDGHYASKWLIADQT